MAKDSEPATTIHSLGETHVLKAPASTTWTRRFALIGPAFIAGAWQFGPGNLISAIKAGSDYGYSLIWVIFVSTILMLFFTNMSVRIGIAAPSSMLSTIKMTLGKTIGALAGVSVFFITLCFSVGNAAGSGLALSMLFGGSVVFWTAVCTLGAALILVTRNVYNVVERILIVLVAAMAVGFIVSALLAQPDWAASVAGIVPSFPPNAKLLIIALVGTNFSINAAFFTSYAAREHGFRADQYREATITDTIPGIVAPGIMTCLVIIVAAAVFAHTGEHINTMAQLANVFEPLAGAVGSTIFLICFFGAAFSSMVANATAGGTLLADGFGSGATFASFRTKLFTACVLAFGLFVVAVVPDTRVHLIIFAQAMTVLVAPFLGALLLIIANNRLMGELRNNWWQNLFGGIGFLVILITSGLLIAQLAGMLAN